MGESRLEGWIPIIVGWFLILTGVRLILSPKQNLVLSFIASLLFIGAGLFCFPDDLNRSLDTDISRELSILVVLVASVSGIFVGAAAQGGDISDEGAAEVPTPTNSMTEVKTQTSSPIPTLSATPTITQTPQYRPTPPSGIPEYSVARIDDLSYAGVIRAEVHVKIESPGSITKEGYLAISKKIVFEATNGADVNAIAIFFWDEDTAIGSSQAYAGVDWAPYGEWSRAGDVETGQYRYHELKFEYLSGP